MCILIFKYLVKCHFFGEQNSNLTLSSLPSILYVCCHHHHQCGRYRCKRTKTNKSAIENYVFAQMMDVFAFASNYAHVNSCDAVALNQITLRHIQINSIVYAFMYSSGSCIHIVARLVDFSDQSTVGLMTFLAQIFSKFKF